VVLHIRRFVGFPAVINAFIAVKDVFGFGADWTAHTVTRARVAVGIDKRAYRKQSGC
jgi:hypothetical protein